MIHNYNRNKFHNIENKLVGGLGVTSTPFDRVMDSIIEYGYHNHRRQEHSDIVGKAIFEDLCAKCQYIKKDAEEGRIRYWINKITPGARGRKIDLLIGEPDALGEPDLNKIRICVENKSVTTAHRNKDARFDDLNESLQVLHNVKPEAIKAATIMVGTAGRYLNIADGVKKFCRTPDFFESEIRPRLSRGDQRLWDEFIMTVSVNKPKDALKTIEKFRLLPIRATGHTHLVGYDDVLIIPVHIDNVDPPYVDRNNAYGINVDEAYSRMIDKICKAYQARWHL